MKIRIQGNEQQCLEGLKKLKKNLRILKVSDFQPVKADSQLGAVYVEVGDFYMEVAG